MKSKLSKDNVGYLFIAPYFLVFAIFGLYPLLYTLWLSFHNWDGISTPIKIGLGNYAHVLKDFMFWRSILNTAVMTLGGGMLQLIFAITLAYVLNQKYIKGGNSFKNIFYFPNLVTAVSLGVLFSLLFSWQGGSVNQILISLKIIEEPINWMINGNFAIGIIILILWFQYFGYYTIVISAGIKGIPGEIMEAASIDGANEFKKLTRIVLPMIKPIITYASITIIIGGMQLFDIPYIIGKTTGEPSSATLTAVNYLYNTLFRNYNYGYGAAVSYALFMVIAVFSGIYLKLVAKGDKNE